MKGIRRRRKQYRKGRRRVGRGVQGDIHAGEQMQERDVTVRVVEGV